MVTAQAFSLLWIIAQVLAYPAVALALWNVWDVVHDARLRADGEGLAHDMFRGLRFQIRTEAIRAWMIVAAAYIVEMSKFPMGVWLASLGIILALYNLVDTRRFRREMRPLALAMLKYRDGEDE